MMDQLNRSIALLGIPWYNVIGNHDINKEAKNRKNVNETFERIYGPSYYSFDHGPSDFQNRITVLILRTDVWERVCRGGNYELVES